MGVTLMGTGMLTLGFVQSARVDTLASLRDAKGATADDSVALCYEGGWWEAGGSVVLAAAEEVVCWGRVQGEGDGFVSY